MQIYVSIGHFHSLRPTVLVLFSYLETICCIKLLNMSAEYFLRQFSYRNTALIVVNLCLNSSLKNFCQTFFYRRDIDV